MVNKLTCSLAGKSQEVRIQSGSMAAHAYGRAESIEQFVCNYGLNPQFRDEIENSGLRVSGLDSENEIRIFEIPGHPFYMGTLFLPQLSSEPDKPHPLITAYLRAVLDNR